MYIILSCINQIKINLKKIDEVFEFEEDMVVWQEYLQK